MWRDRGVRRFVYLLARAGLEPPARSTGTVLLKAGNKEKERKKERERERKKERKKQTNKEKMIHKVATFSTRNSFIFMLCSSHRLLLQDLVPIFDGA
jgi:hypothetical protein